MLFNSGIFFGFFAAFFTLYWLLRHFLADRAVASQNGLILAGSYLFYGWWDERFLLLIALSTACDYVCGLGVAGAALSKRAIVKALTFLACVSLLALGPTVSTSWPYLVAALGAGGLLAAIIRGIEFMSGPQRRKAYLLLSVLLNLGLLGTFKYFGFFTESLVAAFNSVGLQLHAPMVKILLPVGISFYTFQTLSYTIDIYRKQMQPSEKLIDFAAYVAFFPQLVAGPIERAKNLLPQFQAPRLFERQKIESGALLFLWGLFKKIAIADNLAPLANAAFADPSQTSPSLMVIGVIAFTFQIYCDFSGYSDMARGLARMLGFNLMLNFNLPYFSRTPSEFWQRWHISLSSWLRDYLYVPLGGNRNGKLRTYRNLALTMLIGGLWHGAAWTFIIWGAFHGAILVLYRLSRIDQRLERTAISGRGLGLHVSAWVLMSILTLIGWTLFRAASLPEALVALQLCGQAVLSGAIITELPFLEQAGTLAFYTLPLIGVQVWQRFKDKLEFLILPNLARVRRAPVRAFLQYNLLLAVLCGAIFLAAEGTQEFIYFDF